jgi:hypothetical protein
VRGDLIKALTTLMKRGKKFDHVLIETTGLADPAPVAFVRALLCPAFGAAAARGGGGSARQLARRRTAPACGAVRPHRRPGGSARGRGARHGATDPAPAC